MDEQPRPSESHSIISADTIIGLVQRFAMKALESSGHEQIAHWIKEWPEILGDKAGLAIKELLEKRQRGQPITKEDTHKVAETLAQNPRAAATLLGLLTADLLEGAADAESRRKTILQTYSSVLEIVCAYMARNTTSVALKGFIHREDCISYWHFERDNLEFSLISDVSLYPNGLEVYFRDESPDDERIASLNKDISDDPDRHLPAELYDFKHDGKITKLEQIYQNKVTLNRRDPAEQIPKPKKEDPFGLEASLRQSRIPENSQPIPRDLPGLKGLVDSLYLAKKAQDSRLVEVLRVANDIAKRQRAS